MATWTDPSTVNTGPNDPVTSEFGTAALENAEALAEGASGAPKIATKNQSGQRSTAGNVNFTVTGFGGARFYIGVRNTSDFPQTFTINTSTGSYGTAQTLKSLGQGASLTLHGYINFSDGSFFSIDSIGLITTGTVTKTGAVNLLRFTGSSNVIFGVHLMADGGESAT